MKFYAIANRSWEQPKIRETYQSIDFELPFFPNKGNLIDIGGWSYTVNYVCWNIEKNEGKIHFDDSIIPCQDAKNWKLLGEIPL